MVGQTKDSVEDMATALVVCENGVSISMDVSWRHLGAAERFWFDLVGTKGSATVQPLRVFKDAHGTVIDATPTGASGRETPFAQSYRAEWTYFLAVIKGDVNAPPPRDQLALHRVLDAVYRPADGRPDRARRGPARAELSPVPDPRPELRRRHARSGAAAGARARGGPPPGAAPRLLVRPRVTGGGALLAGRRPVALHAALGPRVSRHDRGLRTVDGGAVLARRPDPDLLPHRPALGALPRRMDGHGLGHRPPGRHPLPVARSWDVPRGCADPGAVGRPRGRARCDGVAGLV